MTDIKKHIVAAAHAHTTLTTFHAVMQIMEGGCLYGGHDEASQIISICKLAAQRQLRIYDREVAMVLKLSKPKRIWEAGDEDHS